MTPHVLIESKDRIVRIELNRPEKKSALTGKMYQALTDALWAAEADKRVRVVLIHGHPERLCSGSDLKDCLKR
jgi:enoyl-CoA hydratase/carnithine racemase